MKKLSISILILMAYLVAWAQSSVYQDVRQSFKIGNAHGVAIHFDSYVKMKTHTKEGSFSKVQAEQLLKEFFNTHKPQEFEYDHQGKSPKGVEYAIGTLETDKGSYRLYVKLRKQNSSTYLIDTMDLTQE